MKTQLSFLSLAILLSFQSYSQDPFFANTNQSLVNMNPSFAGTNGKVRDQFSCRNQNIQLAGRFLSYQNSLDFYIPKIKGGIAITALLDDVSHRTLQTSLLGLTYAQHLGFMDGKLKIIPSLQLCYAQRNLHTGYLYFGDDIDPRYDIKWNHKSFVPLAYRSYVDINSGLLIKYDDFYIGLSAFHINRPDIGLFGQFNLPMLVNVHASYNLHLSETSLLNFSERVMMQQGKVYSQFFVNAVLRNYLILGAGLWDYDTPCINVGVRMNTHTIQLQYNSIIKSKEAPVYYNAVELSFSFNLRTFEKRGLLVNQEEW